MLVSLRRGEDGGETLGLSWLSCPKLFLHQHTQVQAVSTVSALAPSYNSSLQKVDHLCCAASKLCACTAPQ